MGLGVTRMGDKTVGACGAPPTVPAQWSTDVFANKLGVVRHGDPYVIHGNPPAVPPHVGNAVSKANQVHANKRLVHRQTDPLSCGDMGAQASKDVFAG